MAAFARTCKHAARACNDDATLAKLVTKIAIGLARYEGKLLGSPYTVYWQGDYEDQLGIYSMRHSSILSLYDSLFRDVNFVDGAINGAFFEMFIDFGVYDNQQPNTVGNDDDFGMINHGYSAVPRRLLNLAVLHKFVALLFWLKFRASYMSATLFPFAVLTEERITRKGDDFHLNLVECSKHDDLYVTRMRNFLAKHMYGFALLRLGKRRVAFAADGTAYEPGDFEIHVTGGGGKKRRTE